MNSKVLFRDHKQCTTHPNFIANVKAHHAQLQERYQQRVSAYLLNPSKCTQCSKELEYEQRRNRFCSKSCAASYNNKGKNRHLAHAKISRAIKRRRQEAASQGISVSALVSKDVTPCFICGTNKPARLKFCSTVCAAERRRDLRKDRVEDGLVYNRRTLRLYLLREFGHVCMFCKQATWNNQPIPLEVDHVDGDATNNLPTNLRLLCPNCHAQTPTYKARNKGNGRQSRGLRSC